MSFDLGSAMAVYDYSKVPIGLGLLYLSCLFKRKWFSLMALSSNPIRLFGVQLKVVPR